MRNLNNCPNCHIDFKSNTPIKYKTKWYKLTQKENLNCRSCGIALKRRFVRFDEVLMALGMGCIFPFSFGITKILLPLVAALLLVRFLAGLLFSVYTISKRP